MRLNTLTLPVAFGALCLISGIAFAEGSQQAQPPAEPPKVLSYAEMVATGNDIVASAKVLSENVNAMLRKATEDADMMKVTCLNDKLTQIDGNLRTAQTHLGALRKAADGGVREHEHTMISVVGQKLAVLSQEAAQCVGQDLYATGDTTVDTDIDNDMLSFEDDPAFPPSILPWALPTLPPAVSAIH